MGCCSVRIPHLSNVMLEFCDSRAVTWCDPRTVAACDAGVVSGCGSRAVSGCIAWIVAGVDCQVIFERKLATPMT